MAQNKQKIHEGIYLVNERLGSGDIKLSVQNKVPKIVTVTMNLEGSTGVRIQDCAGLKKSADIPPRTIHEFVTLQLEPGAHLVTKFKVAMKAPPPEEAQKMIQRDVDKIGKKLVVARDRFRKLDYNAFGLEHIPEEIGHFLDPSFSPCDLSVFLGGERKVQTPVHWRRPMDFFNGEFNVFMEKIEPNDIKQGMLGDCWFMCALASLAERPQLVRRLFHIDQANAEGFYQIFFCKGGEWVRVTVDDYFPCFPKQGPMFSRSQGNELWVLLLEKAYAKLHGSYNLLRGGWAAEGMMDLTGCPTLSLEFNTVQGKQLIERDELWPRLKAFDEQGALISASTAGEDRWTETGGPREQGGLVPGHAYTVIQAKEGGSQRLLNIRNPWGRFEWGGDWSDNSPLWTDEMKSLFNPDLDAHDGTFWMSYADFIKHYNAVNVCRVDSYYEARLRGKFERKKYNEQEWVVPRWYYILESETDCDVVLGIHQDDERIYGVESRRPYIDVGIVVLDGQDGLYRITKAKEGEKDRQAELEVQLRGGKKYVVWPRTTGCALARPLNAETAPVPLVENGELHPLFESTIKDLFRKANVLIGEDLTYPEFHELMAGAHVEIDEERFNQLLKDLPSYQDGLTSEGLVEFFRETLENYGEERIRGWLHAWGYDEQLYSVKSRNYVLTVHSNNKVKVQMHKVKDLNMNEMVNIMLLQTHSERKGTTDGVNLHCLLEKSANCFTYGVYNTNNYPVAITFDCSNSTGLVFSSRTNQVEAFIEPESWKCIVHAQLAKGATQCKLSPVLRVRRT